MCEGQSAAWHPRAQYDVVLHREQRNMSAAVSPQCAQVEDRAGVSRGAVGARVLGVAVGDVVVGG